MMWSVQSARYKDCKFNGYFRLYTINYISNHNLFKCTVWEALYDYSTAINICLYTAVKTVTKPGGLVHNADIVPLSQKQHGLLPQTSVETVRERERNIKRKGVGGMVVELSVIPMTSLTLPTGVTLCQLILMWPSSKKPWSFTQSTTWLCLTQESTGTYWARAVIDQPVMKHTRTQAIAWCMCFKKTVAESSQCVTASEKDR